MSVDGGENTVCNEEGQAGISTISQVSNILELIEVKTDEGEGERSVRDIVPLYPDDDEDEEVRTEIGRVVQLRDLLDDIPAPMTAILAAAQKLFVFTSTDRRKEVEQPVQAVYVPTSTLLLRAWKAFVQQCAISGVKIAGDGLDGAALRNVLAELVVSENDGTVEDKNTGDITAAVVKAILRRFAASNSDSSRAVVDPAANGGLNATPAVTGWKQTEASEHVGRWMLESMRRTESKGKQIRLEDFRRQWSELLPDLWTAESYDVAALLDSVDGVSVARDDPGDQILNFGDAGVLDDVLLGLGKGLGRAVPRKTPAATATKVASASAGVDAARNEKKRKWHEKFGAQRAVAAVKR